MANIIKRPGWNLPENLVTPEAAFLNRRRFLREAGFATAGLLSASLIGCSRPADGAPADPPAKGGTPAASGPTTRGYPAARNSDFNPGWPLSNEKVAANYNNFYEFSTSKSAVAKLVGKFTTTPWPLKISGLVGKPLEIDAQELIDQMTLEERVYRFRCVEAWAMIVPWTGFPLAKLIEKVQPQAGAKFLRFETFNRPEQAPGLASLHDYPWPYTEGLRLEEAMNPLAMVVTGIYGKPLPKQHGAPLRIIVPWKYGYKSAKSIVKIEFVDKQPATLWETINPREYPFESNVNPRVPHPRWSQATERMIDTDDRVPTQMFNGYAKYVESLYPKA